MRTTLRLEPLGGRDVPALLLASAGGTVYVLDPHDGSRLDQFRPFSDAPTVPLFVAADPTEIVVGAGTGGGPRLSAFNPRSLRELWSVYVGDPASRTGVSAALLDPPTAKLTATNDPDVPADPAAVAAVQSLIDALPHDTTDRLAGAGATVDVYAGPAVTVLPRFAPLSGVQTGAGGDGDRTYDAVPAVATYDGPFVPAGVSADVLYHEIGHVEEFRAAAADQDRWRDLFASVARWPKVYEAANETEAFAESFRRWSESIEQPDGRIDQFFDALFTA